VFMCMKFMSACIPVLEGQPHFILGTSHKCVCCFSELTHICVEGILCNLLFRVVLLSVCMAPVINDLRADDKAVCRQLR
jgi:hypothetical protein